MHCSETIFQSNFCLYVKGRYPWNKVDKQKTKFLSEPAKFSESDQLKRIFPTVQNGRKKGKTFIEFICSENEKGPLEKGIQSFYFFVLGFEIGANWLSIKSCIRLSNSLI